jgi:hypothetical protein
VVKRAGSADEPAAYVGGGTVVVNQDHVQSLLRQVEENASPSELRATADEYERYVVADQTLKDPDTGENVSSETLAEVARALREQAGAHHSVRPDQAGARQRRG